MTRAKDKLQWKHMFSEVTLRALLRIHHDYLHWSEPQRLATVKEQRLCHAPGVAFADELTVCGAIAKEFIGSRLPFGHLVDGAQNPPDKDDFRYWRLEREILTANQSRCDFRRSSFDRL